jgi:hypothetical protein
MPDYRLNLNVKTTVDVQKIQRFAAQVGATILVGFPSGRTHVDTIHITDKDGNRRTETRPGKETSELAKELSVGSATLPARPFLEEGLESQKDKLAEEMAKQVKTQKETGSANWDKVGTMAVGAIQEFVRSDYYKSTKPNSPQWIEEKGSDTPLIDGGDLMSDLHYIIKEKD